LGGGGKRAVLKSRKRKADEKSPSNPRRGERRTVGRGEERANHTLEKKRVPRKKYSSKKIKE